MQLSTDAKYRAIHSRDPRFDGWFYTAVTSTGIYCRPSCPARTPKRENVQFYPTAAAAQGAGFRACLRCRPDTVPGSPEWNLRTDITARAMRLINAGTLDDGNVNALAHRLGYSTRHLNRLLTEELGAGPTALARAQRAHTARTLIETTQLTFATVAFASGFASIRQFNDTIREIFAATPSQLRARVPVRNHSSGGLTVRLAYRKPFAGEQTIAFLAMRAIRGLEEVNKESYRRVLQLKHGTAIVELVPTPDYVAATMQLEDPRDLTATVYTCRRILDLDADPTTIDDVLRADSALAPLIAARPGLRIPGAADGFEIAVRAVVGQQISVAAARTVVGNLVSDYGVPLTTPQGTLHRGFPSAHTLASADTSTWAMPQSRRNTLSALSQAIAGGDIVLDPGADRHDAKQALRAIDGIGPWTASYIAMRALADPDEFLPTDLGVLAGAAAVGLPTHSKALANHAQRWRPYRSYALMHLWHANIPKETPQ